MTDERMMARQLRAEEDAFADAAPSSLPGNPDGKAIDETMRTILRLFADGQLVYRQRSVAGRPVEGAARRLRARSV